MSGVQRPVRHSMARSPLQCSMAQCMPANVHPHTTTISLRGLSGCPGIQTPLLTRPRVRRAFVPQNIANLDIGTLRKYKKFYRLVRACGPDLRARAPSEPYLAAVC